MDAAIASLLSLPALLAAAFVLFAAAARADMIDSASLPPWEHCALCHGLDGISRMAKFPKLAGQRYAYLEKQLLDFKAARRVNDGGPMAGIVEQFGKDALLRAARWFSAQPVPPPAEPEPATASVGRALFEQGKPDAGVPACRTCHGTAVRAALVVPRLEAQHPRYLEKQLLDFRNGDRANDPDSVMRRIAGALSDAEVAAVARYLAALPRRAEPRP
jgi:cytochrome c553